MTTWRDAETGNSGSADGRRPFPLGEWLLLLVFLIVLTLHGVWSDAHPKVMADLSPGARLARGSYAPPAGCPARRWRPGELMPHACRDGWILSAADTQVQALPRNSRGDWGVAGYRWVRAGPDAVYVDCGFVDQCRVLQVVADRFADAPPPPEPPAATAEWRRPTTAYLVSQFLTAAFLLICLGLGTAAALVLRRLR